MTSAGASGKKKTTRPGAQKKRRSPIHPSRKLERKPAPVSKTALHEKPRFPSPPLFTVWVLAVVVLAVLIYLGKSSFKVSAPPAEEHVQPAHPKNEPPPWRYPARTESSTSVPKPQTQATSNDVSAKGAAGREAREVSRDVPKSVTPTVLPAQPQTPVASNGVSAKVKGILGSSPTIVSRDIPEPEPAPVPAAPSKIPAYSNQTTRKLASLPPPLPYSPRTPPVAPPAPVGMVAIVIDDLGQNLEIAKKFIAIPLPLTFALLPHQSHTREIAELARSHHHEVLLHLPMEPHGYPGVNPGTGALLLSMSPADLLRNLRASLDSVPNASGVNNHMGSRFTEDAGAMKIVLAELNRRGLYFIDSGTSPASSAQAAASQIRIPFRRRDVFLDHNPSESAVRLQLNRLVVKARVEGAALAIGHPYASTLKVLSGAAQQLRQRQVIAVPARDLTVDGSLVAHK